MKGLYSGLQASVLGTAVSQGIYFYLCASLCGRQTVFTFRCLMCVVMSAYRLQTLCTSSRPLASPPCWHQFN